MNRLASKVRLGSVVSLLRPPLKRGPIRQLATVDLSQLAAFPEYVNAMIHVRSGKFSTALPLLERVHQVISSATGADSPLTVHTTLQYAKVLAYSGQADKAEKTIKAAGFRGIPQAQALQMMSSIKLLRKDPAAALVAADTATNICESQVNCTNMDHSAYAASYGLRGLAYLFMGRCDDAIDQLQLSARWSQTPRDTLVALSNLGVVHWCMSCDADVTTSGITASSQERAQRLSQRDILFFDPQIKKYPPRPKTTGAGEVPAVVDIPFESRILSSAQVSAAKESLAYWEEAIEEASKPDHHSGEGAAAMCGPGTSAGDKKSSVSSGIAGPGVEVISVSSSGTPSDKTTAAAVPADEILAKRLQDLDFAVAYATVLANSAAVHAIVGGSELRAQEASVASVSDKQQQSAEAAPSSSSQQHSQKASELLSSALKTLEPHKEVATVAPLIGRILAQIAISHFAANQAVTAEGLYRSALEKLEGSFALHDERYLFERAVVTRDYGALLMKWEKREETGAALIRDANILFGALPVKSKKDGAPLYVSSLVQMPVPF